MNNSYSTKFDASHQPTNPSELQSILDWWQNMNGKTANIKLFPSSDFQKKYSQSLSETRDKIPVHDVTIDQNQLTWFEYDAKKSSKIQQLALNKANSEIIILLESNARLEFYY